MTSAPPPPGPENEPVEPTEPPGRTEPAGTTGPAGTTEPTEPAEQNGQDGAAGDGSRRDSQPLSAQDVERRFADLVGTLGPLDGSSPIQDATGTPAARGIAGRVVRGAEASEAPGALGGPRDYAVEDPDEEEGYVPPEPEPVEVTEPKRVFAGLLAFAPVVVLLGAVILGRHLSTPLLLALGALFVGGVLWFVSLLPQDRDPQDPGAVV